MMNELCRVLIFIRLCGNDSGRLTIPYIIFSCINSSVRIYITIFYDSIVYAPLCGCVGRHSFFMARLLK